MAMARAGAEMVILGDDDAPAVELPGVGASGRSITARSVPWLGLGGFGPPSPMPMWSC